MAESKYPRTKHDFLELLDSLSISGPDVWKRMEFNEDTVCLLSFLSSLWEFIPNPTKAEKYLQTRIGYYDRAEKIQASRKAHEPPSIEILRKWMQQGIEPQDIVTVLRDAEIDATYRVFDLIKSQDRDLEERNIGLGLYRVEVDEECVSHVPDGGMPLEDDAALLLMSTMPDTHTPMPQWC